MKRGFQRKSGIQLLLGRYRRVFRIPENQNHVLGEDYKRAERRFLKYALEQRRIETQEELYKE